jgi:uncharacterized protein (TIGR02246 family)
MLAVLYLSLLGASACANAPSTFTDADNKAIRAAIEDFTNAVRTGDYARAASWYAEDAVFMPANAPTAEGRPAIQKALEGLGRVDAFSQPVMEVDGVGDLAYARVNYDLAFTPANTTVPMKDNGKVLLVLRKQSDGKWRTSHGMSNSNLPAPK